MNKLLKISLLLTAFIICTLPGMVSAASVHNITNDTYSNYFNDSGDINNSAVNDGDVLDLSGTITNKNMNIKKPLNVTSSNKNATLINCTIKIFSAGSGSNITNLTINNSNENGHGIFLYESENNTIQGNDIHVHGVSAFALPVVRSNYNRILENEVRTTATTANRTHSTLVLGESNYNEISRNHVESDGANCIYLSIHSSGEFEGGLSYYNNITDNTVKGTSVSWCYAVAIMGSYNNIHNNTVTNGYIAISVTNPYNNVTGNNLSATNTVLSVTGNSTVISDNTIHVNSSITAISVSGPGCVISNNNITTENGYGLQLTASNTQITGNNFTSNAMEPIYINGGISGCEIAYNTINTNTTGILLKKQSASKYPFNNIITNNIINTASNYTVDAYESVNTTFASNTLTALSGLLSGNDTIKFAPGEGGNGTNTTPPKTIDLTDANFSDYFDLNGEIKTDQINPGDTLKLTGSFYNRTMKINVPVNITGYGALLYNTTITILNGGSKTNITNLSIINDNQKGIIIHSSYNNLIQNNTIVVNQEYESYAVYLYDSSNNKIIENDLTTTGDYVTYGIFLYESYNNVIKFNKVNTTGTSVQLPYLSSIMLNSDIGEVEEIFPTYGILLIYSSSNQVEENEVYLQSGFTTPIIPSLNCKNSMVGIDIYYDSHNNSVNKNNITVTGNNPFSYGFGVLGGVWGTSTTAENNTFSYNNVNVTGSYFATGFIAGLYSINTTLFDNNITATAGNYSYGVTLESSNKSIILRNKITTSAIINYALELYKSDNNNISENIIQSWGNYVYGLAAYHSLNNVISKNKITTQSHGYPTVEIGPHNDAIPMGNAGIFLMANCQNNTLFLNTINTTALYAVNSSSSNNTIVENNSLLSDNGTKIGDLAVLGSSTDTVAYNFLHFLNVTVDEVSTTPESTVNLIARLYSETGNLSNVNVTFYIGNICAGTAQVINGVANLSYKIPSNLLITDYTLQADASGEYFQNNTGENTIYLNKNNLNVSLPSITATQATTIILKAYVSSPGNVSNVEVKFYVDGKLVGSAKPVSGVASCTYAIPSTMSLGSHSIRVVASGTSFILSSKTSTINVKAKVVPKKADLYISKVKRSGNKYYVTIKNKGNTASGTCYLKLWYSSKKYKVVKVSGIGTGKYRTVKVNFYKYSTHKKKYKYAKINYNRKIIESNYSNNQVKFKK
ncbi:right-handed parallel beta-helix repeat-containing protein [Methanobacterium alcaliphilum]|uniref:right-handed parallel beta-helix repeat-containing protein n=1 Tax=Methanobacterium alcaliphilum TaxID=392018 RepID=UPI00200B35C9|nr:right-handed parallel beta-helix repeat-containing protein [Methanobacterium alcaliphilum]MCK9151831.1 right-handed parallel beta-helix repeat-containing protein [Methanobacterium alcaliphilum]